MTSDDDCLQPTPISEAGSLPADSVSVCHREEQLQEGSRSLSGVSYHSPNLENQRLARTCPEY